MSTLLIGTIRVGSGVEDSRYGHAPGSFRFFVPSLSSASLGSATGSTLLLFAALFAYPYAFPAGVSNLIIWATLTGTAVWIHVLAWLALIMTAIGASGRRVAGGRIRNDVRAASYLSIVAFLAALLSATFQLNAISPGALLFFVPFVFLFAPYLPLVFGPIVLSQSYIFLRHDDDVSHVPSRRPKTLGALSLVTVALIGMTGQVAFYVAATDHAYWTFWLFTPLPAGLTAIGYWILFFALRSPRPLGSGDAPARDGAD